MSGPLQTEPLSICLTAPAPESLAFFGLATGSLFSPASLAELAEADDGQRPSEQPALASPLLALTADDSEALAAPTFSGLSSSATDSLDSYMLQLAEEQPDGTASGSKATDDATSVQLANGDDDDDEDESDSDDDNGAGTGSSSSGTQKKTLALATVDHSTIAYDGFVKKFYVPVADIAGMSEADVAAYREQLDGLKVTGRDVPNPIREFHQSGLSNKLLKLLHRQCGFERPTPVQAQAIPVLMSGRDLIAIARTGSGKTLAYLLPLLRHVSAQPAVAPGEGPIGLVLAPTRELVVQINGVLRPFCKALGLRSIAVYGGASKSHGVADVKRGAEIFVCCPGRLIDLLATNNGRLTNLRRTTFVVLDEADRMFDMGFEPQVTKIVDSVRPDRQTALLSATFPRPVERLARRVLQAPVHVVVGERSAVCADVKQAVEVLGSEAQKLARLLELLASFYERGQILIFVETKESCDALFGELARHNFRALPLHGGMPQSDRNSTLADFRKGACKVLVATSIASRGLDVRGLNLVVNYDVPQHIEDYVHRVGRTGRAGNKGYAYTFVTRAQDRHAKMLQQALAQGGEPVPDELSRLAEQYALKLGGLLVKDTDKRKQRLPLGFGGRGYRFDEQEHDERQRQLLMDKIAHGVPLDAAEEQELTAASVREKRDDDEQLALVQREIRQAVQASPGGIALRDVDGICQLLPVDLSPAAARQLVLASELPPDAAASPAVAKTLTALAGMIEQRHARRLLARTADTAASGTGRVHFEDELEINDYAKSVLRELTKAETLADINEWTGAAVTTKGMHVEQGRKAPPGERKLYLLIEGPSAQSVAGAKRELLRILQETLQSSSAQPVGQPVYGKYRIIE